MDNPRKQELLEQIDTLRNAVIEEDIPVLVELTLRTNIDNITMEAFVKNLLIDRIIEYMKPNHINSFEVKREVMYGIPKTYKYALKKDGLYYNDISAVFASTKKLYSAYKYIIEGLKEKQL